jgi:hypothetical protein
MKPTLLHICRANIFKFQENRGIKTQQLEKNDRIKKKERFLPNNCAKHEFLQL